MRSSCFTVKYQSRISGARVGSIATAHGVIETPAYIMVGTHAEVRCLGPRDLMATRTQAVIANAYHLSQKFTALKVANWDIRVHMNWESPLMTDSGGFQVFSLGFAREHRVGKISNIFPEESSGRLLPEGRNLVRHSRPEENMVRVAEDGAYFTVEGKGEQFLGPRESIMIQEKLGADIVLAFDECTSPLNDYDYTKTAMGRTHKWAKICLAVKSRDDQFIFGIVQGGEYKDLREESAEFISRLPFDGFALGGSLGQSRSDMLNVIRWSVPKLPPEKPRHLLGIGKVRDIFDAVERGIDTFDCVIPTREARHGRIWLKPAQGKNFLDIKKGEFARDASSLDPVCACPACSSSLTRAELHASFKVKNPDAARLATLHNVWFFNNLMAEIRNAVKREELSDLRAAYLPFS